MTIRRVVIADRWRIMAMWMACMLLSGIAALIGWRSGWAAHWIAIASLLPWFALGALLWRSLSRRAATERALLGVIASYQDGDYSVGMAVPDNDLAPLVKAHNALGDTLRAQRLALTQRELLLDTVVQNTPVALLLVDPSHRIVLANLAARRLLGDGHRLEGRHFDDLVANAHPALAEVLERGGDSLFSVGEEEEEDILHLSRRDFRLNGKSHELFLLRQLTAELRRQEVRTWKKVIRIISHELNNSLAPIASLAGSSLELLRRGQTERLPQALGTIEERTRHLEGFIRGYARFAKLPTPRREATSWSHFLAGLKSQVDFTWDGMHGEGIARFDAAQVEQALLNLLKNAHEADGPAADVALRLRRLPAGWRVDVMDRGMGMSEVVIAHALLPFYSTKRNGTGLGLALAREITEAHGGHISLANREGGGLMVSLVFPDHA